MPVELTGRTAAALAAHRWRWANKEERDMRSGPAIQHLVLADLTGRAQSKANSRYAVHVPPLRSQGFVLRHWSANSYRVRGAHQACLRIRCTARVVALSFLSRCASLSIDAASETSVLTGCMMVWRSSTSPPSSSFTLFRESKPSSC